MALWPRAALGAVLLLAGTGALHAQSSNDWSRDNGRRANYSGQRDDWRPVRPASRQEQDSDVTETQKNACKPDVFRLCGSSIPSREKITVCLQQNVKQLNADCRAVMEGRLR